MKIKVKILESIAGLGDPDRARLDVKYAKLASELKAKKKPPSQYQIEATIEEAKLADRYNEVPIGIKKDWSFKPGEEVMIESDLAAKWEEAGICVIVSESSRKAA